MSAASRVTVAIPAYNSERYITHTIESVLRQDCRDWELVVCDDGSTDGTGDICASYRDRGLVHRRFAERGGQSGNWNRCLAQGTAPYVVVLHDDDVLEPAYLRRAADLLDQRPDVGMVHCAVHHIADDGTPLGLQRLFPDDRVTDGEAFWRRLIVEGCLVNPAGVMVRRSLYDRVGGFTPDVVWGIDWHMWLRLSLEASVGYVAEPLARYRQRARSGTLAVTVTARNGGDERWVVEDLFRRVAPTRPELLSLRPAALQHVAHRTWCHAETICQQGFMAAARAGVLSGVRTWPRMIVERRVWALWLATWFGYESFRGLRHWWHGAEDGS